MAVACIVGYGVAGALHARVLDALGIATVVIDPRTVDMPAHRRQFRGSVSTLPLEDSASIDLWLICCPTEDHFAVVRDIVTRHCGTRLLVEKPACEAHQIAAFEDLLRAHSRVKVVVSDHYQHTLALAALSDLIAGVAPKAVPNRIAIAFTKDRRKDIAGGRFVDRSYGVLGYEWLHMLTALSRVLPEPAFAEYLTMDPTEIELRPTFHSEFFVAALTERSFVKINNTATRTEVELSSSIVDAHVLEPREPSNLLLWTRHQTALIGDRHRSIVMSFDDTDVILQLDPVPSVDGWSLGRNRHRLMAVRRGTMLHDAVIVDSAFEVASRNAITSLLSQQVLRRVDLEPLRRIARVTAELRRLRDLPGDAT